ncbi:PAS domain-containing protein [Adhaeribacter sp. BT258]|uniref:histidine kinase n=1 Tax=Adhaeribacter terrigena TaxID=2793070 RepID=A0ABS1C1X7_9BACT|nr:PAS domain-containing protein [Adhaeribacter terrigena]MBK0403404.1 PAS domain-containing protein [Adhaeribacter terrigena]
MHAPTPTAINYQNLFTSLPGLYLILSPNFTILDASDAYLAATLTRREKIVDRNIFEVFPDNPEFPDAMASVNLRQSLQKVLKRRKPHTMALQRYDIRRPKSIGGGFEERYWLATNAPVLDEQGEVLYIVHQAIDVTMQQLAHHHIETNRERIEILAQANTDVIWDVDLLSNHVWWSENLKDIFGYHMHELPHMDDWAVCVHPEDQERVVTGISSVIERGGKIWTDSYRLRRKNGTYANVIERGYILRDHNGIAYRMVGSMFDITDQVNVELQLKESNLRFRKLLDALPNLAWYAEAGDGPDNSIKFLNKAWYAYTGLPEDLLGGGEKVIHPEDLVAVNEMWAQCVKKQESYEQEIRLKNLQTGEYRWFLSKAVPICGENGLVSLWLGTCTDIDDQKKALVQSQEVIIALQKREEHFRQLANAIPQLVWTTLPDGTPEYFNQRWADYTGLAMINHKSSIWTKLLHPDDLEHLKALWENALQTGDPFKAEYRLKGADGNYRWFLSQAQPLRNPSGNVEKWFGTCTEIENNAPC